MDEKTKEIIMSKVRSYVDELGIFRKIEENNYPKPFFGDVQYFNEVPPGFYVVQLFADIEGEKREVGFITLDKEKNIEKKPLEENFFDRIIHNYERQREKIIEKRSEEKVKEIINGHDEYKYMLQKFFVYEHQDFYSNFLSSIKEGTMGDETVNGFLNSMKDALQILPKEYISIIPWNVAYLEIFPEILANYADGRLTEKSYNILDIGLSFLRLDHEATELTKEDMKRKKNDIYGILGIPCVTLFINEDNTIVELGDKYVDSDSELYQRRKSIEDILDQNKEILRSLD